MALPRPLIRWSVTPCSQPRIPSPAADWYTVIVTRSSALAKSKSIPATSLPISAVMSEHCRSVGAQNSPDMPYWLYGVATGRPGDAGGLIRASVPDVADSRYRARAAVRPGRRQRPRDHHAAWPRRAGVPGLVARLGGEAQQAEQHGEQDQGDGGLARHVAESGHLGGSRGVSDAPVRVLAPEQDSAGGRARRAGPSRPPGVPPRTRRVLPPVPGLEPAQAPVSAQAPAPAPTAPWSGSCPASLAARRRSGRS